MLLGGLFPYISFMGKGYSFWSPFLFKTENRISSIWFDIGHGFVLSVELCIP